MLERELELGEIESTVSAAQQGKGQVLVLEGPPGIGKSMLLSAAHRAAEEASLSLLRAAGAELERDFAYGVVRQLFEPVLGRTSTEERGVLFADSAKVARSVFGDSSEPAPPERAFAIANGLYWLTMNLLESGPLLICVDDAHLCDLPSLRWLSFLVHRVEGLAISVILGVRPDDGDTREILELIESEGSVSTLRPQPLTEAAVARMLHQALDEQPTEKLVQASHAATGGNPFLIAELIRELTRDPQPQMPIEQRVAGIGPANVARATMRRLSRLAPTATTFAQAVAILQRAEVRDAAMLAGISQEDGSRAADALVRAAILLEGRPLEFEHPIVRAAVYGDIPSAERARMHRAAARLVLEAGSSLERSAGHLLAAEPAGEGWVVATLREAASEALARGAPDTAVVYLRRASQEPPGVEARAGTLHELGRTELSAGLPEASEHLAQAMESTEDARGRAEIALELSLALTMANRIGPAVDALTVGLRSDDLDHELRRRLEGRLVWTAAQDASTRFLLRDEWIKTGMELEGATPAERVMLAHLAFEMVIACAPIDDVVGAASRALAGGRLVAAESAESPAFVDAVLALTYADRLDDADAAFEDALYDARRRGSVFGFAQALCFRSDMQFRRGRLDEAEADARGSIEASRGQGLDLLEPYASAFLAQALLERGEIEEAERSLAGVNDRMGRPNTLGGVHLGYMTARVRQEKGMQAEALEDLLECGRWLEQWGALNPAMIPWRSAAVQSLSFLGKPEAPGLAEEEIDRARAFGGSGPLGVALRAKGIAGDERSLHEAVEVLGTTTRRLELARALVDLGATLRRSGRSVPAREHLSRGMDLASGCGARPLAERAREELFATGARPRRSAVTGPTSLTPSERRVAEMAARGLSNRDIAQELFITLRTVEAHLSHAYRKLGIHSRGSLPPLDALKVPRDDSGIGE